MLILDFGSGETFKNDIKTIKQAIDEIVKESAEKKNQIIIKWQLFKSAKDNGKDLVPLMPIVFKQAYDYAKEKGIMTTASIFDGESLQYLMSFEVPFVKIANNLMLYSVLNKFIPRGCPIYFSVGNQMFADYTHKNFIKGTDLIMACVSKYPATLIEYEENFDMTSLMTAVSDHTEGSELFKKYHPQIIEKHFKLDGMNHCQDVGNFAITPKEIKEYLL